MTPAEFAAARQRLCWSLVDAAVEFNLTPNVIEGFESGAVRIPKAIAREIRFRSVLRERDEVLAASGLAECPEMVALDTALAAKGVEDHLAATRALIAHVKTCALCRERSDYVDRHGPPLPELPISWPHRIGVWLIGVLKRLPAPIRPPEGAPGDGRRFGFFMGGALSAFACGMMLLVSIGRIAHAGWQSRWWGDVLPLGPLVVGYFVGFYLAGWAWDALRPIHDRFIGYVLRWGIAGAAIYGTIAAVMPFIDSEPMSLSDSLAVVEIIAAIWALIGAGLWVKDRWSGKLAKR
jgi:hypothetical protein